MSTLKTRLNSDLHTAMKARDELVTSTLRMALAAVRTAEVAGKEARELTDDEVLGVLTKEAKKRREAAEAFAAGGRSESADRERAEEQVLASYLPAQLSDDEIATWCGRRSPRAASARWHTDGPGHEGGPGRSGRQRPRAAGLPRRYAVSSPADVPALAS
jgi:uncharacterized protein YqeY